MRGCLRCTPRPECAVRRSRAPIGRAEFPAVVRRSRSPTPLRRRTPRNTTCGHGTALGSGRDPEFRGPQRRSRKDGGSPVNSPGRGVAQMTELSPGSTFGLPIGSQTWPHRATLRDDFPAVLKALADDRRAGDRDVLAVRVCRLRRSDRGALKCAGSLRITGSSAEAATSCTSELRQSQDVKHRLGARRRHHADVRAVARRPGEPDAGRREAARPMNTTAWRPWPREAGIRQGLHNEGFET